MNSRSILAVPILRQMAFILGVGKKTAEQPQSRLVANFGFFYLTVRHPK